jgi:hypothetical protein
MERLQKNGHSEEETCYIKLVPTRLRETQGFSAKNFGKIDLKIARSKTV